MYKNILTSKLFLTLVGLTLSVIALTLFLGAQSTQALSCAPAVSTAQFIADGGTIFVGTTKSNIERITPGDGPKTHDVTFNVHQAWGNTRIQTPFTGQDIVPAGGIPPYGTFDDPWGLRTTFKVGNKYIVYTDGSTGSYNVNVGACASSRNYTDEARARLVSELGQGYSPAGVIVEENPFTAGLLAQIQDLLALVASLQKQLAGVEENTVTDFKSCVAKTGIVQESYPRKCIYNGQSFTENVENPWAPSAYTCPSLGGQNLWLGLRGAGVSSLQEFLRASGNYTYPEITGYFGPATQRAVELWQTQNGVVQYGTPETTGFGVVGPATRAAIKRLCKPDVVVPGPVACTLEYAPVCGQPTVQCPAGADCQRPLPKTYGNSCSLKAAGASYLYEGQCRDDVKPTEAPSSCKIWDDGCNTCSRSYPGGPLMCTLRACIWQGVPKCDAYFPDNPTNGTPVIHGFTGPTVLSTNETGVWEINASDPQNGSLSYQIDWGEKQYASSFDSIASLANSGFVQATTFTHSYKFAGTYTVSITVRDNQGLTAKTTSTVVVGGGESQVGFSVSPVSGNAPLTVTATITLPPRSGFDLVEVCGPIVVGEINWGDGTADRPTRLGCSSQRVVNITHTYGSNGTYSASFLGNDDMRYVETVHVGGINPNSNFSASPTSGNAPLTVNFTAPGGASCVDGADYQIDYGDGTARVMTPLCDRGPHVIPHTYTSAGVYTATLYSIPSGFGPAPIDRTPQAVATQNIIVGGASATACLSGGTSYTEGTKKSCIDRGNSGFSECVADANFVCRSGIWKIEGEPWGPACPSGTNYGGGYYEQCDTPNNTLNVFQPSGGFYNMGDDIRISWSTNVQNSNAAMYLVLEDEATGRRYKSMKVDRGAGQAIMNTGSSCNAFFSDGIDGSCTGLRNNIFDGGLRYRIKAVIYSPANACFGFCAPGSTTTTETIIESYSIPFTLSS